MPPATPYTFTHGDLSIGNIMVQDGNVSGIIDWELSRYFPVWWEYAATARIDGPEDREWKSLLRQNLLENVAAMEFWKEYDALSRQLS